jgi:hypothetical protein
MSCNDFFVVARNEIFLLGRTVLVVVIIGPLTCPLIMRETYKRKRTLAADGSQEETSLASWFRLLRNAASAFIEATATRGFFASCSSFRRQRRYFRTTPQAMRAPALPAGSVM